MQGINIQVQRDEIQATDERDLRMNIVKILIYQHNLKPGEKAIYSSATVIIS